jgi:hypothetical protein
VKAVPSQAVYVEVDDPHSRAAAKSPEFVILKEITNP